MVDLRSCAYIFVGLIVHNVSRRYGNAVLDEMPRDYAAASLRGEINRVCKLKKAVRSKNARRRVAHFARIFVAAFVPGYLLMCLTSF
jgi:hypothetical protein